jgi:hypothetical protein
MRSRRFAVLLMMALLLVPVVPAQAGAGHRQVVDLTFPLGGTTTYGDSFDAPRSGGRVHMATDIMASEGRPIHAAVGGTVEWITGLTEAVPSYGYMIRIAGDDGRDYAYVHLGRNNGPASKAYVSGLAKGSRVTRGQHIGFVGCSGNASCSAPHLHFEIHDDSVTNPYGAHRLNPYPSLRAAEARGDIGGTDGAAGGGGDDDLLHPFRDVARNEHLDAILELVDAGVMSGCEDDQFCPDEAVDRVEMALVMARALQVPETAEDFFSDDTGLEAEAAINALAAAGVVLGCGDGSTYCPDEAVSRARIASYLARGFDLPDSAEDFFSDDDGHGHEANINRLAASGITLGCTAERFCVAGKLTRGQLASFLSRGLSR